MAAIPKNQESARIRTIALRTLAACSTKTGIVAGASHFSQVWTRDSCFGLWGSLTVKDYDTAKATLISLTDAIDENGRVPLRIGNMNMTMPFLRSWYNRKLRRRNADWLKNAIKQDSCPVFHDDKKKAHALDSASLLIMGWAIAKSIMGEKEYEKIATKSRINSLGKAFEYYKRYEQFGLLYQYPYADWADSIKRKGYSSYVNMLYYAAARSMATIVEGKEQYYNNKADEIRKLINDRLWRGTHYADFVDSVVASDNYSMDANMLAIIFKVCSAEQEDKILKRLSSHQRLIKHTGLTVYPEYSNTYISTFMRIIGMRKYHNGMQWLWISAITIMALQLSSGKENEDMLKEVITNVDEITERNRDRHSFVSEIYLNGKPFSNMLYHSEEPFGWSSGLLVCALDSDQKVLKAIRSIVS
jgi:glycogen debranching enzyme